MLTHCHADHDAGTFQKVLQSRTVKILTTQTIMDSFVRKYSAISGFSPTFINSLFQHIPVKVGEPVPFRGGELHFHYSVHTIPTVGVTAHYNGKKIAYSGDTCYNPDLLDRMYETGVMGKLRYERLYNFSWDADLILHEAGVPPIHTPAKILAELPEDVRQRMFLVHTSKANVPEGLKMADEGQTISLPVQPTEDGSRFISLVEDFTLLKQLVDTDEKRNKLWEAAVEKKYAEGADLPSQEDKWSMVLEGVVTEKDGEGKFIFGDVVGDTPVGQKQKNCAFVAATDVTLMEVERPAFEELLNGTEIPSKMKTFFELMEKLDWKSRETMKKNSVFSRLTSRNRFELEQGMCMRSCKAGEVLWSSSDTAEFAFLVHKGLVVVQGTPSQLGEAPVPTIKKRDSNLSRRTSYLSIHNEMRMLEFGEGSWIGDTEALMNGSLLTSNVRVVEDAQILMVPKDDVVMFYSRSPGVLLAVLGRVATQ
eukprot:GFYU01005636.1.p1 GENE.GFYU01005636.1~~GFYU01005636.1.p1  ORF type:complete len:543 (-),score=157.68 GFYU01005636.1:324-1760(-)